MSPARKRKRKQAKRAARIQRANKREGIQRRKEQEESRRCQVISKDEYLNVKSMKDITPKMKIPEYS